MAPRNLAVREVPLQARLLRRRGGRLPRSRLEALESAGFDPRSGELLVALVWLVLGDLPIAEDELNAARRRAMFVLAAGGDPHRELDLTPSPPSGSPASSTRRSAARRSHDALGALDADGLPTVAEAPDRAPGRAGSRLAEPRARPARRRARRRIAGRRDAPLHWPHRRRTTSRRRRSHLHPRSPAPGQAPAQPSRRPPPSAVLARRRAVLPQPRLLRPHRRARGDRRGRALPPRAARLVDPDPARARVHVARERPGLPHGRPDRAARPDRRREGPPARRHDRPHRRRRRRRRARRDRLERAGTRRRRASSRSAACRSSRMCRCRRSSRASAARSCARRSRRRSFCRIPTARSPTTSTSARRVSGLQGHVTAVAQLPAGRVRQHVPRPARRGQPGDARARSATRTHEPGETVGVSGVEASTTST